MMYEFDLSLISQGITWLLSTGAGAFGSYKVLQYRIGKIEEANKDLTEVIKKEVVHVDHCVMCKENTALLIKGMKA